MRKYVLYGWLALMGVGSSAGSMQPPPAAQEPVVVGASGAVNCDLAALMPDAPLRVDECKALVDLYQTLGWVDPRASRDGDEQLTCADLRSELTRAHGPERLDGRFNHSLVAVAQGLSESIHANPRLGRLVQLAAARDCSAADDED
jgi:hypothetical protein